MNELFFYLEEEVILLIKDYMYDFSFDFYWVIECM